MAKRKVASKNLKGKRVYISGPMTGLPDYNYPMFDYKEERLWEMGFVPVNPANNFERDTTRERWEYLKEDIKNLLTCDYIMFLPGFERSAGALLEALVARECNIPVLEIEV